jgi:hypothetical protein
VALIPISFREQIIPGSFEFALNDIVDNVLDLSLFEKRFSNDETGAPACGSEKAIKDKGKFRLEGKEYIVQGGDILSIRFNG